MSGGFRPSEFPEPVQYTRGGKAVLLDLCRRKLVPTAPEEVLRQKFILFLIEWMRVPRGCISTEESLSHFGRGARGRADVVVWTSEAKKLERKRRIVQTWRTADFSRRTSDSLIAGV